MIELNVKDGGDERTVGESTEMKDRAEMDWSWTERMKMMRGELKWTEKLIIKQKCVGII